MKIGIVLYPYGEKKPSGLARTIFEWTKVLLEADAENKYLIFFKGKPEKLPEFGVNNWQPVFLSERRFWMNGLKNAPQANVYIFQTPVLPLKFTPKNSVIIAQDFPYLHLMARSPKRYFLNRIIKFYHAWSLKRAARIIAVSEYTKRELMKFFHVPEEKIAVVPMGYKKVCKVRETQVRLPEKFFLFVGVVKERKNVLRIFEAFSEFKKLHSQSGYKLAIGGKSEGTYFEKVKSFSEEKGIASDIVWLGFLNDGELSYVYRRARTLLFPSIVESFGFPVLEAMSCGLPVITSDFGGPSEIGSGNSALLVDPYNANSISKVMEKIAFDDNLREKLIQSGRKRAEEFSWDKAADGLLKVINSLKK